MGFLGVWFVYELLGFVGVQIFQVLERKRKAEGAWLSETV